MAKNELVSEPMNLETPAEVKPSSMPNKGGSGMGSKPGYNELVKLAVSESEPGDLAGGANQPSVWGKEGSHFSVGKSSAETGTSMSAKFQTVDLNTGMIVPNVETDRS